MERHPRLTQTGDASLLMRIVNPQSSRPGEREVRRLAKGEAARPSS